LYLPFECQINEEKEEFPIGEKTKFCELQANTKIPKDSSLSVELMGRKNHKQVIDIEEQFNPKVSFQCSLVIGKDSSEKRVAWVVGIELTSIDENVEVTSRN